MATENRGWGWGYDRIVGALSNPGYHVSDQTIGNALTRHAVPPAPDRGKTGRWLELIRAQKALLSATDFFTAGLLTPCGIITDYIFLFMHLESRHLTPARMTEHPNDPCMKQIARNVTQNDGGCLEGSPYLIHDGDTRFTDRFREILRTAGTEPLRLPPPPNLNAYTERWILSIKSECPAKRILCSEASLRRASREYIDHYHRERNHQGKDNLLLFPNREKPTEHNKQILCRERFGGLPECYHAA